jgi:hypothetical protein
MEKSQILIKELPHPKIHKSWLWGSDDIHCLSIVFDDGFKKEFTMYDDRDKLFDDAREYLKTI